MEICKISLASNGSFPRTDALGGASYWQLKSPEELLTVFRPQSRGLDFIQHKWNCFIYSSSLMAREECSLAARSSRSPVPDTGPNTTPFHTAALSWAGCPSSRATQRRNLVKSMLLPQSLFLPSGAFALLSDLAVWPYQMSTCGCSRITATRHAGGLFEPSSISMMAERDNYRGRATILQ